MKKLNVLRIAVIAVLISLGGTLTAFAEGTGGHDLGSMLPIWSIIPFVGLLLSLAIIPLIKGEWWEHNMGKTVIFWSLAFLIPFGIGFGANALTFNLLEIVLLDYLPFIVLLFGLFAVSGGIVLRGTLVGTPKVNLILLLIGTILASWIGTTGAACLMIRPVIRANKWRVKKAHVIIFFIFLVANMGGSLTPIGDPPLFLGFLRGVPFFWTMHLLPLLLFNSAILLVAFFILDTRFYKKELAEGRSPQDVIGDAPKEPLKVGGAHNVIFLAMIIGAVILSGTLPNLDAFANQATGELYGLNIYDGVVMSYNSLIQMGIILLAALLSMKTTQKAIREENSFTWASIIEVAKLFIGIFITMIPALALLRTNGAALGLSEPAHFFWATGMLSSFLDNAPTYLVFMTTAGSLGAVEGLVTGVGVIAPEILIAVSAGAVFMGANTYIGNAPNFMVRSIAEENKITMPSFFGYMGWSLCFLIPLFILDTIIFF
ncbi:MAG: sodium:proton antiporter [Eubacteriales bacterium]|nr:sodium:proton antiporter [Eubacteriales bacterium]